MFPKKFQKVAPGYEDLDTGQPKRSNCNSTLQSGP